MNKHVIFSMIWKAASILSCFLLFGCENDQKTIDEWTRNTEMVEEAKDVQTFLSQNSKMKAKLWAPLMIRVIKDTSFYEFPKNLHVNFFDSTGKVESHLDSKYGKYFESINKVFLRDSVIIYNVAGDTLRTPELWWDQSSQRIYTTKAVKIRKSGNLIYGIGMDAKQDLSDVNIKQVTGTVFVADSLAH